MAKHDKVGPFRIIPNKRRGNYQIDIPPHLSETGKRQRPSFASKREATKEAQRLSEAFSDKTFGRTNKTINMSGVNLNTAGEQWLEKQFVRVKLGKKRKSSLEKEIYHLATLIGHMGTLDIAQIAEREMEGFQHHRLEDGRKPATINSEIATLKSILQWAKNHKLIDEVPLVEQMTVELIIPDLPTIDEMRKIVECIDPKRRVLLMLMAETGCRRGEAQTLPWEHVDQINGTIKFQRYVNSNNDTWQTKRNASVREVPISIELLDEIHTLDKVSEYVFPGRNPKKPIDNFRRSLKTAVKKSDVKRHGKPISISPQVIRKAVMTWHIENGTAESIVQALCGHARGSRVTQKAYLEHRPAAIKDAIISMAKSDQTANKGTKNLATNGNKRKGSTK